MQECESLVAAVAVQNEQPVAIGAFNPAGLVHVEVDAGVPQCAVAAVADDLDRMGVDDFWRLGRGCCGIRHGDCSLFMTPGSLRFA